MNVFEKCFLSCVVMIGLCANSYALDVSQPLAKLKAAQLLPLNSGHFHKSFDEGLEGNCTSLIKRLDKALHNEESEYAARVVYGEMYDRAICVPYDPSKAFENFKRAADMGGPMYYAHVGWKYANGHGVEKSDEKAKEAFKILLIRSAAYIERPSERFENFLRDRQVPALLKQGIDWLTVLMKSNDDFIKLANNLIYGRGLYYDGTALPIDNEAARNILSKLRQKGSLPAKYKLALEHLKGSFGEKNKGEGQMYLIGAARCGYIPAILELAEQAAVGEDTVGNRRDAYGWYLMAERNGANVTDKLEKAKQNAGSYVDLQMDKYTRYKINTKFCE